MSDRKSRQMLRRAKEQNKEAIIVACGCYVQVAKEEVEKIEEIDLSLGNNEKKEIVEIIERYQKKKTEQVGQYQENTIKLVEEHQKEKTIRNGQEIVKKEKKQMQKIEDVMKQKEYVELGQTIYTEKTRAVIKIQDGCDRFCSYCIIPYARGRVRSRKPENIISEIQKIAQKGIQEVVITGIHIASYGKDLEKESNNKEGYKLIDLLEEINKIEGIKRIRLGSIEPLLITEEFIERLVILEKICHHFHLSLQSGCDETLKRMNRRYTTKQFKEIVKRLRTAYQDVILTTDIIVGFPRRKPRRI